LMLLAPEAESHLLLISKTICDSILLWKRGC
jgi:hypothetical protein